ncbi:hypothetical protein GALMADRAFT_872316 [Galerina marginata CBS 339.88]|uniref:F-box domain-containing protein n=1 Tax=Galerina marginata (strain CBS 339.88) TaxID=685588 RepID=A0A067TLB1_GALM3|nr:hypothetical protein GALMADRAFT_872316 [Galerina marginata CBS 339.88]
MDPQISKLFANNDPPSDGVAKMVQELIVTRRRELELAQREIQTLQNRLKELTPKCETIQQSISDLSALISLRRLPTDLLREVFLHCLPAYRNPTLSALGAPMVLTRVCGLWRSVALSYPRLWARLHIPFSDDYLGDTTDADDNAKELRLKAIKVLQLRCNVVEEWLMRSGTCPLDISIHYDSRRFRDLAALKSHGEGDLTIQLFKVIFHFKDRLQSLQLKMHENIYSTKFEVMVPEDGLRMLRTLRTGLYLHPATESQTSSPITLLNSPNLTNVAIYTDRWRSGFLPLTVLQRLASLSVDVRLTIADAFSILKNCGNLVHCQLIVADGAVNPDSWLTGVANLPHLKSLQIFDEDEPASNPRFMLHFYSAIRAPHMKWINYQFSGNPRDTTDGTFPILPLLESAKELKKLTLDLAGLPDSFIRKALETKNIPCSRFSGHTDRSMRPSSTNYSNAI